MPDPFPADAALGRALALVRDLRARCPWDRAQTPQTLRPYLVEEALELDQAIRRDDAEAMRDELGDLLFNVACQIVIADEGRRFDAEAVVQGLERKMWRRHPHLFDLGEPPRSWEHGKRETGSGNRGILEGLPPTLPALLAAYRLQERAAGVGFDWPDASGPLAKVQEELAELEGEQGKGTGERVVEEIGDLLFAVVNLARKLGVEPGQALERANEKFRRRFATMETLASERGMDMGRAGLEQLDRLWDDVKAGEERTGSD